MGVWHFFGDQISKFLSRALLCLISKLLVRGDNIGHWHLTEFYGHSDTSLRAESWRLLTSLHGVSALLWLVIGDFNKIMSASEEWGAQRPTS